MRKIKVAQIGTSMPSHGNAIFKSLTVHPELFEIAGVVFPENEREKCSAAMPMFDAYKELTLDEVLNDESIEAVFVETEEKYLTKYALLAAKHKKHIHMEKPGGMLLSDFEELIEAVKANNVIFHTGYMYRYNPEVIKLLAQVKSGELGEIISVEAQMNSLHDDNTRRFLGELDGGIMFFLGCHIIDLVIQIQGFPKRIIPLNRKSGLGGIDSTDFGMAAFEYEHGISFVKTCSVEYGGFDRRKLVVNGTRGCVELSPLEHFNFTAEDMAIYKEKSMTQAHHTDVTFYNKNSWADNGEKHTSVLYDRYFDMLSGFAEMVVGERENHNSPDYELSLYKTILESCK